jgi:hypothetical protein
MKKLLIALIALVMIGCEKKECVVCEQVTSVKNWNLNNMTEYTDVEYFRFSLCEQDDVDAINGTRTVGNIVETSTKVFEQTTIETSCD